jgi:hypothetical protein
VVLEEKHGNFKNTGLNETVEVDSEASLRPWKQIQGFQWDRGILYDTSETFAKTIINSQFL